MKDSGLLKEAIHCYVTAIRLLPTFAAAHRYALSDNKHPTDLSIFCLAKHPS